MTEPRGALLVGSVNLPDAETVFRTAADVLGDRLKRIPDGEPGDRFHWIAFQPDRLAATPGIERVGDEPILFHGLDLRSLRVADGVDPATLEFASPGYADAALESWAVFRRLLDEGAVPASARFQVSLPTPAAVVGAYFPPDQQAVVEPAYARALYGELDRILAAVPHERLAIQWDTAVEFALIEAADYETRFGGAYRAWFDDVWAGVIDRAVEQASHVPVDVELGFHLCYGDAGEEHFVQPADTGNLARFASALLERSPRPIQWIHLPVPIDRADDGYFAPLTGLELPEATELYLGLVHREDGVAGAERRISAATRHVTRFGVATECGCGRAPREQTVPLLETHRAVAAAW